MQNPPVDLWKDYDYQSCLAAASLPIAIWDGIIYWAKLSEEKTGFEESHPKAVWGISPLEWSETLV